ncbi:hypothetical protein ABEB36_014878 [Hypothenemus hampei]|uniref:SWIM-type domain-containing protein n=1 Tax=Hypothenemus hampei TaxID=57062 RepID=A0ABD1E3W0_HYPHA
MIKGYVHASMKKRMYTVEVNIDLKAQEVSAFSCTCPRGQVVCHHLAALLYFAHYNISATDIERRWGITATRGSQQEELQDIQTIENLYPRKQQYIAVN